MPRAVIVTALPVEYLAVRAYLSDLREEAHPQGTIYERGQFVADGSQWDVGIVEIGAGNVGAALEAERAIAYFDPDVILFVGVAAGIRDVAIGDVVASTKIYGYESGKAEQGFKPRSEIGLPAYSLEQRARSEARKGDWLQRLAAVPKPTPQVFVAPIAAGEKVIASTESEVFQFLRENYRDAIAVEMEGLGFLESAQANVQISAMVIRGISDLIDTKLSTATGYQETAARHASAFAFEILSNLKLDNPSNHRENKRNTIKKILILSANPENTPLLRLNEEVREIQSALERSRGREQFEIISLYALRSDDLRRALLDHEPQIVHFSGHGVGKEGLVLEDHAGQMKLVSAQSLARLFKLFQDKVECVLLNACYLEVQAAAIHQYIDHVIGMSQAISDRDAISFSVGFYDALAANRGYTYTDAFEFGLAALDLEGIPDTAIPRLKQRGLSSSPSVEDAYPLLTTPKRTISVFFSYSYKDEVLRDQLAAHLSILQRQKVIQQWHDRQIVPGTEWNGEIDTHLNQADIILLLISADFLASNYFRDIEVNHAMQRHQVGTARVVPILLRPTVWSETPLSSLQTLPSNAQPVTLWADRDEAFHDISRGLRAVVKELTTTKILFQAPPLPVYFVRREYQLQAIKEQLLLDDLNATNTGKIIAIKGMGGVGKTVLATAIAHDLEIRQHFSDGVLWANLGQQSELLSLLQDWVQVLGGHNFQSTTIEAASDHLIRLLCNKSVLLILDDAQDISQVKPFVELGSQCCVLITSRNVSNLSRQIEEVASIYDLDVLAPEEALEFLSRSLNRQLDKVEQDVAMRVVEKVGYHPLALNLMAGLIRQGESWSSLEQSFTSLEENFENDPNERISLLEALYAREIVNKDLVTLYSVQVLVPSTPVSVGSEIEVGLQLSLFENGKSESYLLEIPRGDAVGGEINILLTAPGFQFNGANATSLPLIADTDIATLAQRSPQIARFPLTALQPGTITVKAELFCGDTFKANLERTIQVSPIEVFQPNQLITARSRPVPQPDLILQIQTVWNENLSSCTFRYHLDSFHPRLPFASEMQQQSDTLTAGWLEQTRSLLQTTLEEAASSLPEDFRARLTSLGQYLFQHLLPLELQTTFRSVMRLHQPFTLLILADQDAGLPWELLHDGQSFWGDRFILGRWSWELEQTRPYEFAIGAVNLAHYAEVEQPEPWAALLEPSGAPPPMLLSGGVLADLRTVETMRGLHLLRRGKSLDEADRQDAPVRFEDQGAESLEQELQPAKLSLRRNRPLVTLGYVSAGLPELTTLEQTWAPTFIRGGCSAFVGPLWAVSPAVEAAFVSSFYQRLWAGDSLGVAFQAGRRVARSLVPDALDWLAYTLFGDPMARPYRPSPGQGYAVVEPIGQEITDPIAPGTSVRFRVSLRRSPPVWYSNRLMDVAEDLTFNDLQVYITASGLPVAPADSIDMQQTPTGDYLGWFTLTVPATFGGDRALVQVHFEDGGDPIHSLRFALTVGGQGSEPS